MNEPLEKRILKEDVIKIPRNVSRQILQHKNCKAFELFLQLKPLYVSGVLLNDGGIFPYKSLAKYLGISLSGLRGKIRQLKKYKLIHADKDKNFHLASYKKFVSIFRPQFLRRMRKYTYKNVASSDALIKVSAIRENLHKQEYIVKNKIINQHIFTLEYINGTVHAQKDRIKQPEGISKFFQVQNDCPRPIYTTDLSRAGIRKMRKSLLKDYDNILHKQKMIYREEMMQPEDGLPQINPYITLSCAGIGRLFCRSASAGHYQRAKLSGANLISVTSGDSLKIHPVTMDGREELRRQGGNIYSFNYPVKRSITGRQEKFFIRLPDNIAVNLNFIYENAKN